MEIIVKSLTTNIKRVNICFENQTYVYLKFSYKYFEDEELYEINFDSSGFLPKNLIKMIENGFYEARIELLDVDYNYYSYSCNVNICDYKYYQSLL